MFGKEVALYLISLPGRWSSVETSVLEGSVGNCSMPHISRSDEIVIEKDNIRGQVYRVGLLHTWLKDEDGNLHMIGNKYLEETPVKVSSRSRLESSTASGTRGFSELKF